MLVSIVRIPLLALPRPPPRHLSHPRAPPCRQVVGTIQMQIKDDEVAFPTTDSTGFRDRNDLRSLQMDAYSLATTDRKDWEKKKYGGKECTEEEVKADVGKTCKLMCKVDGRLGTEKCSILANEDPQTIAENGWTLWLLFKRKEGKVRPLTTARSTWSAPSLSLCPPAYPQLSEKPPVGATRGSVSTSRTC